MNDVSKRFIDFYNYLKSEKIVKSAAELASILKISPAMMTEIKKGRSSAGLDILQKLLARYRELNPEWLLSGRGTMLLPSRDESKTDGDKKKIKEYLDSKGLTPVKFYKKTGLPSDFLESKESLTIEGLRSILEHYPDLNIRWLLYGVEPMLIDPFLNNSERLIEALEQNLKKLSQVSELKGSEIERIKSIDEAEFTTRILNVYKELTIADAIDTIKDFANAAGITATFFSKIQLGDEHFPEDYVSRQKAIIGLSERYFVNPKYLMGEDSTIFLQKPKKSEGKESVSISTVLREKNERIQELEKEVSALMKKISKLEALLKKQSH